MRALTRCSIPCSSLRHSSAPIMRGRMSNGDQTLRGFVVAVDCERTSGAPEQYLRLGRLLLECLHVLDAEPFDERAVGRTDSVPEAIHFVEYCDQGRSPWVLLPSSSQRTGQFAECPEILHPSTYGDFKLPRKHAACSFGRQGNSHSAQPESGASPPERTCHAGRSAATSRYP